MQVIPFSLLVAKSASSTQALVQKRYLPPPQLGLLLSPVMLSFSVLMSGVWYKRRHFSLGTWSYQHSKWRLSSGHRLNDPAGVSFFHSILDQNTSFRRQKQTEKKITQLEGEGLQSLKIDDGNSPKDRYINFPPDRTLKSSRWFFFFLFAPFLIKIHLKSRADMKKNVQMLINSVSVWLPFGHILHKSGSWFTMF